MSKLNNKDSTTLLWKSIAWSSARLNACIRKVSITERFSLMNNTCAGVDLRQTRHCCGANQTSASVWFQGKNIFLLMVIAAKAMYSNWRLVGDDHQRIDWRGNLAIGCCRKPSPAVSVTPLLPARRSHHIAAWTPLSDLLTTMPDRALRHEFSTTPFYGACGAGYLNAAYLLAGSRRAYQRNGMKRWCWLRNRNDCR